MSGMAGNVSAFATVWTYDIYRAMFRKQEDLVGAAEIKCRTDLNDAEREAKAIKQADAHYVSMGRWCTIVGVLISIGTAYLVRHSPSIMDYVQELFSFFIAPLFGTVLLGMFWKRATGPGGFWGLLAGTGSSIGIVGMGQDGPLGATIHRDVDACQGDGGGHVSRPVG